MAASVHPSASHHPSNPGVHEDLLVEILKRLPLKPMYRFRCVCRSWNSLLSSPFFISHRLRFVATETTFFRVTYADNRDDPPSCTLHDHQDSLITSLDSPLQFHIPWAFIGVVHGVVCHLGLLHFLEIPGYTYTCSSGCFINGNIHWVIPSPRTFHASKSYRNYRLLLFDCEREEFTTMNLPEEVQLLIFKGGGDSGYFEAWRMDEYGVATSWSKQHNVLPNDQLVKHHHVSKIEQFVFKESMLLMDIGKPY